MKYIEIIVDADNSDTVLKIAKEEKVQDFRLGAIEKDGKQQIRMLVSDDKLQLVLDALQNLLVSKPTTYIIVLPVDLTLPEPEEEERKEEDAATKAREALYEEVEKGVRLDVNFIVLVILSSLVATIGLITNKCRSYNWCYGNCTITWTKSCLKSWDCYW